jgi:hypothetical protein
MATRPYPHFAPRSGRGNPISGGVRRHKLKLSGLPHVLDGVDGFGFFFSNHKILKTNPKPPENVALGATAEIRGAFSMAREILTDRHLGSGSRPRQREA